MSEALKATWSNTEQARKHLNDVLVPWARSRLLAGQKLVIEARLYEDALTDKQRRYYHGVVLQEIAQQAAPGGVKHSMTTWKEYFRAQYLGHKTVSFKDPMTSKTLRRRVRVSTEDLGVKKYALLIERVTAFAVTDLGVRFSADFDQYDVDPETGEILG